MFEDPTVIFLGMKYLACFFSQCNVS